METKEQRIERLKKERKHEKEMIEVFLHYLPKNCDMVKYREIKIKELEQQLKELEEGNGNKIKNEHC